jgi:hypothetical protein
LREGKSSPVLIFSGCHPPSKSGPLAWVVEKKEQIVSHVMQNQTEFRKTETNAGLFSQKKTENLESTSTSTTAGASAPTASWSSTATTTTTVCLLARLVLRLGRVVDEEGIKGKTVGENVIANGGTADIDGVERNGVAALGGHLDGPERSVHLRRDRHNSAVKDCA